MGVAVIGVDSAVGAVVVGAGLDSAVFVVFADSVRDLLLCFAYISLRVYATLLR